MDNLSASNPDRTKKDPGNRVKITSNGYFVVENNNEPFLLEDSWIELIKFGDKKMEILDLGAVGHVGIYKNSHGEHLIHFVYKNLFIRSPELSGYEFLILPKPSVLERAFLDMFSFWSNFR